MADPPSATTSTFSSLLKGVGGIAASVIAAVLIYYLTRPAPTPPTPPPVQTTEINGFVADAASLKLLPNAVVVVALGQNSVSQQTDELGRYNVALVNTGSALVMGEVSTKANGYKPYSNTVALKPGDNFAVITLEPDSTAPPRKESPALAAPVAPAPQSVVTHAAITFRIPPANYIRKPEAVILRAKP
jgi:hypothetical protein